MVITATDSAAQKYATVFPDYFAKAMGEASSDLDKNGRTSFFEVFSATSAAVKQHYEQRGQLTTERAAIDDNGDGVGREAEAPGPGRGDWRGSLYLDAEPPAAANNPELAALLQRRRELEADAEALKLKKGTMAAAGVGSGIREADDRAGAGVSRNPLTVLIASARPPPDRGTRVDQTIGFFRATHSAAPVRNPAPASASRLRRPRRAGRSRTP